jgi:hypothetical protein
MMVGLVDALMVRETLDQSEAYEVVGRSGPTAVPERV